MKSGLIYPLSFFVPLLLCACSATGPAFTEATIPRDNDATVVIYRPNAFVGVIGTYDIKINNQFACDLHNAAFFTSSGHHGQVTVSSTRIAAIGTSRITIDTKPHKIYYVRMENNDSKTGAVIGAGFVGLALAEGISSSGGPFIFTLIDEVQAKRELQDLRLDTDCLL